MLDRFGIGETYTDSDGLFLLFGLIIVQIPCRCKILVRFRAPPSELLQLKRNMIAGGMVGRDLIGAAKGSENRKLRLPDGDHVARF